MVKTKGQLTIQYLLSFIFFLGLIIYIYFAFSSNIPKFLEAIEKEDTHSKAYQLSELLLSDPGYPIDWENLAIGNIKRLGLSDENSNKTNLLSSSKVHRFFEICGSNSENFSTIQEKLALNQSFSVIFCNITSSGERECQVCQSPNPPKTAINTTIRRIVALNASGVIKLAELIVQM